MKRDTMDIKEWLDRGREIYKRVKALEKRRATEGADLSDELDREWRRLDKTLAEITALISHVEDNTLATLLQDRYVRCMTWGQIAAEMDYSREHLIRSLHPAALEEARQADEI